MISPSFRLLLAAILVPSGIFLPSNPQALPLEPLQITIRTGEYPVDARVPNTTATVGEALVLLGVPAENAFVAPEPTTPLTPGASITVLFPITVRVRDGNQAPRIVQTFSNNVETALRDAQITVNPLDRVEPTLSSGIFNGLAVSITRVTEEERVEAVPLPFLVRTESDPELSWERERVMQPGRKGSAEARVRIRMENGKIMRRTLLERTVLEEPITEVRARGTKIVIGRVFEGGASWYRYRGCFCAASTIFPKGTYLRVTNLENGKQVIVRVNDYGPTAPGRVVDLDAVAFKPLQPLLKGIFSARVEEILP